MRSIVPAGAVLLAALALTATPAAADDWGQRVAGRHVYDTAGALTPAQTADLESAAAAVDRAGATTVVYLRSKSADDAAARQDARALMDAWAVESASGARDGFVLLVDLQPGAGVHGSAALVAGAALSQRLSDARLQAIYEDTMKPALAKADLAGALAAALGDIAEGLTAPPPRSPTPQSATSTALAVAGTVLGLGGAAAAGIVLLVLLVRGGYRDGGGPGGGGGWRRTGWYSTGQTIDAGSTTSTGGDGGASSGSSSGGGSF